jgi:hypothetical protein
LTAADVESMVDGLRYRAVLEGARGRTPVDRTALVGIVLRFARLVTERGADLDSFEINPLLVASDGLPVAVDALAVCAASGGKTMLK